MTPDRREPTVYLVDDDAAVRDALAFLLGTVGLHVRAFPDGPALIYTRAEIAALLLGAKDGEFDHLAV